MVSFVNLSLASQVVDICADYLTKSSVHRHSIHCLGPQKQDPVAEGSSAHESITRLSSFTGKLVRESHPPHHLNVRANLPVLLLCCAVPDSITKSEKYYIRAVIALESFCLI